MNSNEVVVTDEGLINSLNNIIREPNGLKGNGFSNKELQDSLRLKQGQVKRFYPNSDKVLVQLNNNQQLVSCVIIHPFIASNLNMSFVPDGYVELDNIYNEPYVIPYSPVFCLVLDIESGSNKNEMAVLGFISTDNQQVVNKAFKGEIVISCGDTVINVNNDMVNIKTNHLFWNGVEQSSPVLTNIYEKHEVNEKINNIKESLRNDLEKTNDIVEDVKSSIESLNLNEENNNGTN